MLTLRVTVLGGAVVGAFGTAHAGGMILPGPGAITTTRAGAGVASTDTGEAIAVNPAGLARTEGTTVTVSTAAIDYSMTFRRRGTYDDVPNIDLPYEGQPYPVVEDGSKAKFGVGGFQPIPVIAVTHAPSFAPQLRLAFGLSTPNSYPFREMCTVQPNGECTMYEFGADPNAPPTPTRYDVVTREASLLLPTLAASYRVLPNLDVGARFGWGISSVKSQVHAWSSPNNTYEDVGGDSLLTVSARDNFVPSYGVGLTYRISPNVEVAANYNSELNIDAKGTASTQLGERSGSPGVMVMVVPVPDDAAQCAPGGRVGAFKACVSAQIPRNAMIGGRYRFLSGDGVERGDIELNVGWENWGNDAASNYAVVIDSEIVASTGGGFSIKKNFVRHGFQDVFLARLGGSWKFPMGANTLIARGGVAYDTAAAKEGWLRSDVDGTARTTIAAGGGFRTGRFQFDAGFGVVLAGSNDNPGDCNPIGNMPADYGCNRDGIEAPLEERTGPDPINPLVVPEQQRQAPFNQGIVESRYLLIMLGMTASF